MRIVVGEPGMGQDYVAVHTAIEITCWVVSLVGVALLGFSLFVELLRRHGAGPRIVRLGDRLVPTTGRRISLALLAVLSSLLALTVPRPALADAHVRGWLTTPSSVPADPERAVPGASVRSESSDIVHGRGGADAAREPAAAPGAAPRPTPAPPRGAPIMRGAEPAADVPAPGQPVVAAPEPTRPLAAPSPVLPTPAAQPTAATEALAYTVEPGDCLWSIAKQLLGDNASNRSIDRGWRVIYAANARAVGGDPNLIHPGLVLAIPTLDPTP